MIVTTDELRQICEQAEAEYPNECCGVIMTRGGERQALRFRNMQDAMHRMDPKRFPRTAQRAYYVGLDDHRRMDALVTVGFAVSIIYHSHPDAAAYFSPTDRDNAAPRPQTNATDHRPSGPPPKREPVWPGVTYLVVSVMIGRATESAAFRWDTVAEDFTEIHKEALVSSKDSAR
jgi:proteasome lid subunit RPN8/RPN11